MFVFHVKHFAQMRRPRLEMLSRRGCSDWIACVLPGLWFGAHAAKQIGLRQEGAQANALALAKRWERATRRTTIMRDELERGLESGDAIA